MSNDTETLTLSEFLLARIAEDEGAAATAADDFYTASAPGLSQNVIDHIARHSPGDVLAECEAKRLLVKMYAEALASQQKRSDPLKEMLIGAVVATTRLPVQEFARVYADHPDYDPIWSMLSEETS